MLNIRIDILRLSIQNKCLDANIVSCFYLFIATWKIIEIIIERVNDASLPSD